jgi:hypothetical protein
MAETSQGPDHWDAAYESRGTAGVSWFQATPSVSLGLIEALGVSKDGAVIDIGGGASSLVDHLLKKNFGDLTVLDLSGSALESARRRLPGNAPVKWLHEDILSWRPQRQYDLWHDRAAFHFLVDKSDRDAYLERLDLALVSGGAVVVATFALDGPEYCSGLPVARYSADDLASILGEKFEVIEKRREEHSTPGGTIQPFTWIAARSKSG